MIKSLYSQLKEPKLILRDILALERTALANERTLLSYVRTMIGLIAVGGTLVKLSTDWFIVLTGWIFLIFGVAILVLGFTRYIRMYVLIYSFKYEDVDLGLRKDKFQFLMWRAIKRFV